MGTPNRQNFDAVLTPKIQIFGCPKWPSKFWQITWFWPFKIPCFDGQKTTHFWPSKPYVLNRQNHTFWMVKISTMCTHMTQYFDHSKPYVLNRQNPMFWWSKMPGYGRVRHGQKSGSMEPKLHQIVCIKNNFKKKFTPINIGVFGDFTNVFSPRLKLSFALKFRLWNHNRVRRGHWQLNIATG